MDLEQIGIISFLCVCNPGSLTVINKHIQSNGLIFVVVVVVECSFFSAERSMLSVQHFLLNNNPLFCFPFLPGSRRATLLPKVATGPVCKLRAD